MFQSKVKGRIQLGSDRVSVFFRGMFIVVNVYFNVFFLVVSCLLQRKSVQQLAVVASQKKLLALVDGKRGLIYLRGRDVIKEWKSGAAPLLELRLLQ